MLRYEILILTVPEITADESDKLEKYLDKILKLHKASMISFERWGKLKLAYPIRNYDYGVYFLIRFEIEEEIDAKLLKEIDTLFKIKLNDLVMRYMNTKLDIKKTLDYKRPPSVDQIPTKDVEEFIKENKMEGILKSTEKQTEEKKEKTQEN